MRMRNKVLYVYLSEDEHNALTKKVAETGLSTSAYIRNAIMGIELRPRPPDDYYNLLKEINAIGVNINQIAHIANFERTVADEKIAYVVELIEEVIEKVRDLE